MILRRQIKFCMTQRCHHEKNPCDLYPCTPHVYIGYIKYTLYKFLNSLKKEEFAIDPDTWYDHFRNLNSVKSKFDERLEQLNQVLENDKQTRTFHLMDTVIKDKEILNSIAKLKNNKSSGLDSIRNEMIKTSVNIFLPC